MCIRDSIAAFRSCKICSNCALCTHYFHQPQAHENIFVRSAPSVSYTHLDVYKRQEHGYAEKAEDQQLKDETITPNRGVIYDTNMKVLARSATVWDVTVSTRDMATYGTDVYTCLLYTSRCV